jgi:hypothetical protein
MATMKPAKLRESEDRERVNLKQLRFDPAIPPAL